MHLLKVVKVFPPLRSLVLKCICFLSFKLLFPIEFTVQVPSQILDNFVLGNNNLFFYLSAIFQRGLGVQLMLSKDFHYLQILPCHLQILPLLFLWSLVGPLFMAHTVVGRECSLVVLIITLDSGWRCLKLTLVQIRFQQVEVA